MITLLLPYSISLGTRWHTNLEELCFIIEREEKKNAEGKRVEGIKKAALGKLSKEEREALGV